MNPFDRTIRTIVSFLSAGLLALATALVAGCSSGGSTSGPGQAITVSVAPASATVQTGHTQSFTATVANSTNTAVTWQVNGVTGGDATHGTISGTGMYTAPTSVPSPATVTVAAVSQADTSKSGSAQVTVTATAQAITVSIDPGSVSVGTGAVFTLTATVQNDSQNLGVTWSFASAACTGTICGTLSNMTKTTVKYSAPSTVPNPATVDIKATSVADPSKSFTSHVTILAAAPITVSVSPATPSVQTSATQSFAATVQNDTGNKGVNWTLTGTGCSGATCGTLSAVTTTSVTYTAPGAVPTPATVTLTATSIADGSKTFAATITVTGGSSGPVSVSLTPVRGGLAVTQTLALTATVQNDVGAAGVTWSASAGSVSNQTTTSATYTAPGSAGVVTITATSVADVTKSATATIGVTDLAGVYTYRNNPFRDGTNPKEYALTPGNVNSTSFAKLFSCAVDGEVYAQPLWVANLAIGGGTHNVIFVATENDSVYAFDGDINPCHQYWKVSFLGTGVTTVPPSDTGETGDINKKIGITGTPVIDPTTKTIYLVAKTKEGTANYHQRLHALSLTDGSEKFGGPVDLTSAITVSGTGDTGDPSSGCTATSGSVPFCTLRENQRPGLALANGVVYVAWASHGDQQPYHGWVMGFNAGTLARVSTYNDSPNGYEGGIWMSGGAPAIDSGNNLYLLTGNGDFDGTTDFGDSFLKLSSSLSLSDWFTPNVQDQLNASDLDLGSGGAAIVVDLPSGSPVQRLLVGGGKGLGFAGQLYVLNRDALGHTNSTDSGAVQQWSPGGAIFSTPAFWQNTLYLAGVGHTLRAFALNPSTSMFSTAANSESPTSYGFPGASPAVTSNGATNGIVWALDTSANGTNGASTGAAVLHAYDATNLATELWNSSQGSGNAAATAVKFLTPTVANGKAYVATQTEIDVYGLKPN